MGKNGEVLDPSAAPSLSSKVSNTVNVNDTNDVATTSKDDVANRPLLPSEQWNIGFLVLAWACVVATMTLVVGTGAIVVKSVGGSNTVAPFSLGAFFFGMSFISLTCTHWIFKKWGRTKGFQGGIMLALLGVAIGCIAILIRSPALVIVTNVFLGAGSGIGMYLRFAAVEVVPSHYHSRAVAWVLSGGCLAAFIGPESAQAAKLLVSGHDYMGVFIVAGLLLLAEAIFVSLVQFPAPENPSAATATNNDKKVTTVDSGNASNGFHGGAGSSASRYQDLKSILMSRAFLIPLFVGALSWTLMAMPMSIFRVAMKELSYTERQSLTVIEIHFLGMYGPGFYSGGFIARNGPLKACALSFCFFLVAALFDALVTQDNNTTTVTWYFGLILLGVGWHFGFSAATVWATKSYTAKKPSASCTSNGASCTSMVHLKSEVQAANECGMFFLSGLTIFATGYLFEAGGGGLKGWQVLNLTLLGPVGLTGLLLLWVYIVPMDTYNVGDTSTNEGNKRHPSYSVQQTPDDEGSVESA